MAHKKHAELIRAWLDGAEIQYDHDGKWVDDDDPDWYKDWEYRIKPAEPERVYPKTKMSDKELWDSSCGASQHYIAYRKVSDEALRHAIDNGQVISREEFDRAITDRKERDMTVAKHVHDKIFALLNTPDAQCKPIASFVSSLSIEKLVAEVK